MCAWVPTDTGYGSDLVPNRPEAIIWTNGDLVLKTWCIYVSPAWTSLLFSAQNDVQPTIIFLFI